MKKLLLQNIRRRMSDMIAPETAWYHAPYPTWTNSWWKHWGMLCDTEERLQKELANV